MEKQNKIVVKKLSENIWHMDDAGAVGYVVVGKDKALVIDTMNGSENVYDIVRDITDKPLVVVNTHSHPDHIGGNCFFDAVYMHENDVPFIDYFTPDEKRQIFRLYQPLRKEILLT